MVPAPCEKVSASTEAVDGPPAPSSNVAATVLGALAVEGATEQNSEKPPEDLALRERLASFCDERGRERAQSELGNAVKILQNLGKDMQNTKFHQMNRDVLERTIGEGLFFAFEAAGFSQQAGPPAKFVWRGSDAAQELQVTIYEVQRAADQLLDPETVSFSQVTELVHQGRTLPGISTVDDKVMSPVPPKESSMDRPKKPWES